jgi:hypothetical protein
MTPKTLPTRRAIVAGALALPATLSLAGLAGCHGSSSVDRQLVFSSLSAAEKELSRLAGAQGLISGAVWNWDQTLEHCAQSIEFSMQGFPEPKSNLFQSTIGSAAFEVFAWRGRMKHDLADPIPGAPLLADDSAGGVALARLREAIANFRQWTKPLQPHFATETWTRSGMRLRTPCTWPTTSRSSELQVELSAADTETGRCDVWPCRSESHGLAALG